jgi:hypothetical protein
MKKIFLAVMVLAFASCEEPNVEAKSTNYRINPVNSSLTIITVDGCQYLYGNWGPGTVLTHKGNCNNPIHKSK